MKIAKTLKDSASISECEEMLSEVNLAYQAYNEKVNILKLINVYDTVVEGYDELLEKREKINDILKNISDSRLYDEIFNELNKEYNTIKVGKQDIENYENLKQEREKKNKLLYEIDEENNSKEFKAVIDELVKNENRVREEKIRRAKKEEYQERQKKLIEEQKIEASRVRRQKLIEEARLKEQQERLEKVKQLQEKTVINPKKEEKVIISKEEPKEEKINNPLKNKTFDEMISFSNDFDTDELFENTKIVPNKKLNEEKSLFDSIQENTQKQVVEDPMPIWEAPTTEEVKLEMPLVEESIPVWETPNNKQEIDLFKEEPKVEEVVVEESKPKEPSIYDILENNKNIIWKTTDTNVNKNTIPVIGNNNLKPEVMESKKVENVVFPKIDSKEGEILWKETL